MEKREAQNRAEGRARIALENEHIEVVVGHHRAPVGLGIVLVEPLPHLQGRRIHVNGTSAAHVAPHTQNPPLPDDELGRLDFVAACFKNTSAREDRT